MLQFLISTIEDSGDKLVFEDIYYKYKDAAMRRALRLLNGNQKRFKWRGFRFFEILIKYELTTKKRFRLT